MPTRTPLILAFALLGALEPGYGFAQGEAAAPSAAHGERRPAQDAAAASRAPETGGELPKPSMTSHGLTLGGLEIRFTATAGAIRLVADGGPALADIVVTAYTLDGADPATRSVTFVVNGGPGASSAWLQLGTMGPWRLKLDGSAVAPSLQPDLVENDESWLPFTDLVFIDPAGTGYSRLVSPTDETRRRFFSVEGDVEMLAATIRRWVEENRREMSPKYFAGESYGGFRGPLVARNLIAEHGVGLSGLILVSPVLDFRMRDGRNPVAVAARLPSMVAAARRLDPELGPGDLADVERIAVGPYLADLIAGPRDEAARDWLIARVSELTGLDRSLVARRGGRIDTGTFLRELERGRRRVGSAYDATATGLDPNPYEEDSEALDPILDTARAPLTAAARRLYQTKLGWVPSRRYEVLSSSVNRQWDWGRSLNPPQSAQTLGQVIAADPRLRVLVVHGATDLVTPYFATKLVLDQIAVPDARERLSLEVYRGGHMFYFEDASRAKFRDAGRRLIERR